MFANDSETCYVSAMANRKYNTIGCPTGTVEESLWAKVIKTDRCWLWGGATSSSGYGVLQKGKRGEGLVRAHRLSYEIHNGKIPQGMLVLHSCDNKLCVNPDHLSCGDYSRNIKEAWERGLRLPSEWNMKGFPSLYSSRKGSRNKPRRTILVEK